MSVDAQPFFAALPDPRRTTRNKLHPLRDIVMLTLYAVVCGCEDWVAIEDFGCTNEAWFRQHHWSLPHGIPSHDTLSDVMGRLNPEAFASAFAHWAQQMLPEVQTQHIAIDGKCLRGSRDGERSAMHLLSAYAPPRPGWFWQPKRFLTKPTRSPPCLIGSALWRCAPPWSALTPSQKTIAQAIVQQKGDSLLALKDTPPPPRAA